MSIEATKEITKFIWSLGNYEEIAKSNLPAAQQLLDSGGVADGDAVLDVGTGNGNLAILAAQRGANVSACDLTPRMLELAQERARTDGVAISFVEGDAEDLPYADEEFDHVLSVFGAIFAPRPDVVAKEMFRVCRPGGFVGLTAWHPEGAFGRHVEIIQSYAPGAGDGDEETSSDLDWARAEFVQEKLGPYADGIELQELAIVQEAESAQGLLAFFETNLGPLQALKQVIEPERYEEMRGRLTELYDSFNRSPEAFVADVPYVQVLARKKA